MVPTVPLADPLHAITPSLSRQLKSQTDQTLATLIRTNYSTKFAQRASELTGLRDVTVSGVDDIDDETLSETFRNMVQFTTYGTYEPFLARLREKTCREKEVIDLFAPGIPDYIVGSSSTSGRAQKIFPKYNRLRRLSPPTLQFPKRTAAFLFFFRWHPLDVRDEDDRLVKTIYSTVVSGETMRSFFALHPEKDAENMTTFVFHHVAPFAVGFINIWRSFLLIHALFALGTRSLRSISAAYLTTFVDMMRHLDKNYEMIVDAIESGSIPDLEGLSEVRRYLEATVVPDPERAAELRSLGRPSSRPGWCSFAWPNFCSVIAIASGFFASCIPLAKWFLGPNINIRPAGYSCTEGWIGSPYNPLELNQFKLNNEIITEFLDIDKDDSVTSLAQPWEVTPGKRYEVVVTTRDGLWRYRVADVVEIAGFDRTDGTPIISYVERRDAVMRFTLFTVTEKALQSAISLVASDTMVNIVDWTSTVDNRHNPDTIGFFVELAGAEADFAHAAERILDTLLRSNEQIGKALASGSFGAPTVRIVGRETFSDFRQLRLEEGSYGLGQVKTPVVLPKEAYVDWFQNRVVKEL